MIFISYSSKDKKRAADIKKELDSLYMQSFLAHEDIEASAIWSDEILKSLRSSTLFLGVVTKHFNQSPWCQQELGAAFALRKPILLVKIDSVPSGLLARIQAIPLSKLKKSLLEDRMFLEHRITNWINATADARDFEHANAILLLFKPNWDYMEDNSKLNYLAAAGKNNQVYGEGYKSGPFFKSAVNQLESKLSGAWLREHDCNGVITRMLKTKRSPREP